MTSLLASGAAIPGRLEPTDLQLKGGTFTAVIGPNGGGKTSLLRALAGVEPAMCGQVWVGEEELREASPARRPYLMSFLPAARDVPWSIGVCDAIALGLPRPEPERVDELITLLELEPLASRSVDRLSTGERARVLLARALAPRPRTLLLDEPCSNLAPYWAHRILEILSTAASDGAAVCISLHDLSLLDAFDRVLLVDNGAIREDGHAQEVLGSSSFSEAFRIERHGTGWRINPSAGRQSSR